MDTIQLPPDFREFLKSLNSKRVEYLVIGGYAVGYHGYPRPTGDLDIWISNASDNADRAREALKEFGFNCQIDIVNFSDCYSERVKADVSGVEVSLISLPRLKENKKASGRSKDVTDLEHLP